MMRAGAHVELAGGDRALALGGVQAVGVGVVGVVEEVGAARGEAEADERDERLRGARRRSSSTPAAAGAANTRTFLVHCFGRAVLMIAAQRRTSGRGRWIAWRRLARGSGTAAIGHRLLPR